MAFVVALPIGFYWSHSLGAAQTPNSAASLGMPTTLVQRLHLPKDVSGVTWSPDGKKLATVSQSGTQVTIWDTDSWQALTSFRRGNPHYPNDFAFLPDGHFLAPATNEWPTKNIYALSVWDVGEGALVENVLAPEEVREQGLQSNSKPNTALNMGVSRDGKYVAIMMASNLGKIFVYDSADWHITRSFTVPEIYGHPDSPHSFSFSLDDKRLAVGTLFGRVLIYDLEADKLANLFTAYPESAHTGVNTVVYSPDDLLLATGPTANDIQGAHHVVDPVRVWRAADGSAVASVEVTGTPIYQILWNSLGTVLTVACQDHVFRAWRLDSPAQPIHTEKFDGAVHGESLSPTGQLAIVGGDEIVILQ